MIEELARNIAALQATLGRHGLGTLMSIEVDGLQLERIQRAAEASGGIQQTGLSTHRSICGVVLKAKQTPRGGW